MRALERQAWTLSLLFVFLPASAWGSRLWTPGTRHSAVGPQRPPAISLARLDDPLALERELRQVVTPPYDRLRLSVPDGLARRGDFTLDVGESISGHLLVVGGKADIFGKLKGNLVTLDGDILVHPGAVIAGDALALGGRVRNLGGKVQGESRSLGGSASLPARPGVARAALTRASGLTAVLFTLTL